MEVTNQYRTSVNDWVDSIPNWNYAATIRCTHILERSYMYILPGVKELNTFIIS